MIACLCAISGCRTSVPHTNPRKLTYQGRTQNVGQRSASPVLPPVGPTDDADTERRAVLEAVVRLQRATSMRPGEVLGLRAAHAMRSDLLPGEPVVGEVIRALRATAVA